jgi:hypothetical protein
MIIIYVQVRWAFVHRMLNYIICSLIPVVAEKHEKTRYGPALEDALAQKGTLAQVMRL